MFKDCVIYEDKAYKWEKYPVIRLSFFELAKDSSETLKKSLNRKLYKNSQAYGVQDRINLEIGEPCEDYLEEVIDCFKNLLDTKGYEDYEPIPIILIDEYDSPLIFCK